MYDCRELKQEFGTKAKQAYVFFHAPFLILLFHKRKFTH